MSAQQRPAPAARVKQRVIISPKEGALDELKVRHGIVSDSELARRLGISAPMLSQVRSGRRGAGSLFMLAMLEEFGEGFHLGEDCIYQPVIDGVPCEMDGP